MSAIEYNSLVFKISQRVDELNVLSHLRFMFRVRGRLASGSEDNIHDALSLFKELEEQNILGADRLVEMKELLSDVEEWSLLEKVEKFESKRKEYRNLLEQIIIALGELNELERLIAMCRGKISEESEGRIHDVRSLFKELENENNLGIYHLDILKAILAETENNELLNKVEKFEERRKQEAAIKRKKAKATAFVSSIGNTLTGVLNIKTVFKAVAVVSTAELLIGWSTYDQLVPAVNTCVLPAGTSLVNLTDGCLCLTVQAETLSALTTLWNLYQDGTLERRLYNFFVTDEVKERAGEEKVEVNVSIDEEEYDKARLDLMNKAQEAASLGDGKTIRRNSDSDVFCRSKEEVPLLKLKHAKTELKFHKERIAVIMKEIAEELSPEILEECSPEEKATFLKQNEIWKGRQAGEMNEKTDKPEMSLRSKPKSMDPEKFAYVQKYLEDVQDTRSMTTEVNDSGLATHTAASEIGIEEINEADKLCLKDLSSDVTKELDQRLEADEAAMEKFYQFFGLKRHRLELTELKHLFPDTTVGVLKKCFEALMLYDLSEILEKVRPRSLRPAVSPKQIEKLRRADDRPTKYHSDVAVLVVDLTLEGNIVKRETVKKIETFFKDLNSRNEVAIISWEGSQKTQEVLREITKRQIDDYSEYTDYSNFIQSKLDTTLQTKARLEKELEKVMQMEDSDLGTRMQGALVEQLRDLKQEELEYRVNLVKVEKQAERDHKKLKELDKTFEKSVSMAMDDWVHNQEKFTGVAVFIIRDEELNTLRALEKLVVEKLALIPDHTKLVVLSVSHYAYGYDWESMAEVPEILYVMFRDEVVSILALMIEIFNKRWQTLDLISMMHELKRNVNRDFSRYFRNYFMSIKLDSLSTLPTFQKKEEEHSS